MGGPKIAAHAQRPSKDSKLKRGKTYLFDGMGLLYAMATRAEIADALGQTPPTPTRDLARISIVHSYIHALIHTCTHTQMQVFWRHLDKWYELHKFNECVERGKKVAAVKLIFVVDGKIDACKIARNFTHDERQKQLDVLKREIVS